MAAEVKVVVRTRCRGMLVEVPDEEFEVTFEAFAINYPKARGPLEANIRALRISRARHEAGR